MNLYLIVLFLFSFNLAAQTAIGGEIPGLIESGKDERTLSNKPIEPMVEKLLSYANERSRKCSKSKGNAETQKIKSITEFNIILTIYSADAEISKIDKVQTHEKCGDKTEDDFRKCYINKGMKKRIKAVATHSSLMSYLIFQEEIPEEDAKKIKEKLLHISD
jgi:hypothetical protein